MPFIPRKKEPRLPRRFLGALAEAFAPAHPQAGARVSRVCTHDTQRQTAARRRALRSQPTPTPATQDSFAEEG
jgi:hypothetical protein